MVGGEYCKQRPPGMGWNSFSLPFPRPLGVAFFSHLSFSFSSFSLFFFIFFFLLLLFPSSSSVSSIK